MKLAVLGCGNMGGAFVDGLLQGGLQPSDVVILERNPERLSHWRERGCLAYGDAPDSIDCDVLLCAVKPQYMNEALQSLRSVLPEDVLVISIMAGVSIAAIQEALGTPCKVIRAMPNLPASCGAGMTGYFCQSQVTPEERSLAITIFEAVGRSVQVSSEDAIDAVTAVSGSGPAYFFYLLEHLMGAAGELGFSIDDCQALVAQTMRGALQVWESSELTPEQLRQQVTSKGGTTEAAIAVFDRREVNGALRAGVHAAYRRARVLGGKQ